MFAQRYGTDARMKSGLERGNNLRLAAAGRRKQLAKPETKQDGGLLSQENWAAKHEPNNWCVCHSP